MSVDTHDSPRTISWSPAHTVGVEQELHTVSCHDFDLVPGADTVLAGLRRVPGLAAHVADEYMANTVEFTTPVSATVGDGIAHLRRLHNVASRIADEHGMALSPLSVHPFADPAAQQVTASDRYRRALAREAVVGQEQQIIGVHVHVGVPSGDAAVRVMDELSRLSPLIIALSASSPFHRGADTGYDAFRPMLGDRLPPSGVAPHFDTWQDFLTWYDTLAATGYVTGLTDIWWDVRPSRYGTVEMRIADGCSSYADLAAIAALVQCIAAAASHPDAPRTVLAHDQLRLNRFEAQRHGLDARISLTSGTERIAMREAVDDVVARLLPIAARLGCAGELAHVRTLARMGNSATRQRRHVAAGGDLPGVVRAGVAELAASAAGVSHDGGLS